jgi:hypothetical protein
MRAPKLASLLKTFKKEDLLTIEKFIQKYGSKAFMIFLRHEIETQAHLLDENSVLKLSDVKKKVKNDKVVKT